MAAILFFKGQSAYDVVSRRIEIDRAVLEARGHDVRVVSDFSDPDLLRQAEQSDLMIGYQGWGTHVRLTNGQSLLDTIGTPYAGIFGDHPGYHVVRLADMGANRTAFFSTRSGIAFAKDILGSKAQGREFPSTADHVAAFSWANRDVDVLLAGTGRNPERFLNETVKAKAARRAIKKGYRVWRQEKGTRADTFTLFITLFGNDLVAKLGDAGQMMAAACQFDLYCRFSYRFSLVKALSDRPITLLGSGWRTIGFHHHPDTVILDDLPYQDYLALLQRTKVAINLVPPHFDFHERIIDSASQGAAVITPKTGWLAECFSFGEELLAAPSAEVFQAGLADLLDNPSRHEGLAEAGWARVRADFSDMARADRFEALLNRPAVAA